MYTRKISLLFGVMMLFLEFGWAQCGLNSPLPIRDLGTQYGYIRIENASNNDLASVGQGYVPSTSDLDMLQWEIFA
ncbi:MAG: hypothetical protein IPL46_34325 [Saprospiraceae bacterium]|nr:hypothetical protein [Saprospiraceae bacterium]